MIILFNIEISNTLDDSIRTEILAVDSSDLDAINNIGEMADVFIDLNQWSRESITKISKVKPINISTDEERYDIVNKTFNK